MFCERNKSKEYELFSSCIKLLSISDVILDMQKGNCNSKKRFIAEFDRESRGHWAYRNWNSINRDHSKNDPGIS